MSFKFDSFGLVWRCGATKLLSIIIITKGLAMRRVSPRNPEREREQKYKKPRELVKSKRKIQSERMKTIKH